MEKSYLFYPDTTALLAIISVSLNTVHSKDNTDRGNLF